MAPAEELKHGTAEEVLRALEVIGVVLKHGGLPFDAELRWLGDVLERLGRLALARDEDGSRPCDNSAALGRLALRELGLSRKTRVSPNETLAREWIARDLVRQGVARSDALSVAAQVDLQNDASQDRDGAEKAPESLAKDIQRLKRARKTATK